MNVRLAVINDCKQLSYLKKEIWETTYRGIYSDEYIDNYDYVKREEKFKKLISDNKQEVYVCINNNKIVGYLVVGAPLHGGLEGYEYAINDIGISKDYRGKGYGKKLFNIVKEKKIKFFNCCNYYNESGRKFYEHMGGKIAKVDKDENDKSNYQVYYIYKEV